MARETSLVHMATGIAFKLGSQSISVPEEARDLLIDDLWLSIRLSNVLRRMGCERLGDLHGRTYSEFWEEKNCGQKTILELKTLIAESGSRDQPTSMEPAAGHPVAAPPPFSFFTDISVSFGIYIEDISERIEVPEQAQDLPIDKLKLPTRLGNVLRKMGCERLGDLHGRTYLDVWKEKNCGRKTLHELKALIVKSGFIAPPSPMAPPPFSFSVPEHARDWPIGLMPIRARLAGYLWRAGFERLGDLHGLPADDLLRAGCCDHAGIAEIKSLTRRVQEGEFDWVNESEPNLRLLLDALDGAINGLRTREREIILWRFGGTGQTGQTGLTLEEIGAKYNLTRTRVGQIIVEKLKIILKCAGPLGKLSLNKLAEKCLTSVCPLAPETLIRWLGEGAAQRQFPIPFYIRLSGALNPEIPIWPCGQQSKAWQSKREKEIVRRLEGLLLHNPAPPSLSEALDLLRKESPELSVQPFDLLEALRGSDSLLVEFVDDDRPRVRLAQLKITKWENTVVMARAVLSESDRPLSADEIIERARHKSGEDFKMVVIKALSYVLTPERGFYLLGRRAFGLRQHFRLPESSWDQVRSDFYGLLLKGRRPISTLEVVSKRMFGWADLTNAYEIAQLLREDSRFVDLGRRLFALHDWGIEKREMVSDLVVKILEEAAKPMSVDRLTLEVKQLRSIATKPAMKQYLEEKPELCGYGAGYYGIKSWGDKATEFLITEPRFINHSIAQLPPPLSFKELCQYLKIPDTGPLADCLWQTVAQLPSVRRRGGENKAETMLRHQMWTLEYSLYAMLSQFDRPLSVSEIQEKLGGCFDMTDKEFAGRISRCHQWSNLFARTRDGKYRLKE